MATLQSSGAISISQINAEFGRGNNLNAYRGTTWYTDAGGSGTFSSGAISMSEFYSKRATPAITISLAGLAGVFGTAYPGNTAFGELLFNSNGTISYGSSDMGTGSAGSWATPTTTGIGSSYWVRATHTGSYGTGGIGGATQYGSAKGAWHQISNIPYFGVQRTGNGMGGFYYTLQIASDSGGSNILATATNVEIAAEIIF